jgi:hypothetical protein
MIDRLIENLLNAIRLQTAPTQLPTYEGTGFRFENQTVGGIISQLLTFIYPAAGLILLAMLIWGGITLMTAANNPGKAKTGYNRMIYALIGFLIVFVSYFVLQLVEVLLGVKII